MDGPRECSGCKRTWLFELESDFDDHERACLQGAVTTIDPLTGQPTSVFRIEPVPTPNTTGAWEWTSTGEQRRATTGHSTQFAAIKHLIAGPVSSTAMVPELVAPIFVRPTAEMIEQAQRAEAERVIRSERLIREAHERRDLLRQHQAERAEKELAEKIARQRAYEAELILERERRVAAAATIEADCHLCRAFRELKDCIDLDGTAPSRCLDCMERTAKARGWITDAERHEWEERSAVVNAMNERLNAGTPWEEFVDWWKDQWGDPWDVDPFGLYEK